MGEGMNGEPWVKLETGPELADWNRTDEIGYNQQNRQRQKLDFYRNTFDFLTDNRIHGDYMEFGCHRARTFRMALTEARKHNLDEMRFWAFDSFEGLPELENPSSVETWKAGALKTSVDDFKAMIDAHGIYTERVHTVVGYYSDRLSPGLAKCFAHDGTKAALITVDCDLYESAVPVFDFIEGVIQDGTVIYLDDLFAGFKGNPRKGVARAFREYSARSRWRFEQHLNVGWGGRSYIAWMS